MSWPSLPSNCQSIQDSGGKSEWGLKLKKWITFGGSQQLNFEGYFYARGIHILTPCIYDQVSVQFSSVAQSCLFATPWTVPQQASLSITNSQSLLKFMSIVSVMPSSHLILCHPLLLPPSIFPSRKYQEKKTGKIRSFPISQFFASGDQSFGVSASASVLPMNIQDWFPLGWTGWISLQSKGLSRVFSNTQFESINSSVVSFL